MDFEFKLHVQVTSIKAQTELGPMYSTSMESELSYIIEYFILVSFDSLEEMIRKFLTTKRIEHPLSKCIDT